MAEKTASVKVTLNDSGLINGVRRLEGRFESAGRRMGAALDSALSRVARGAQAIPQLLKKGFDALPSGVINGLKRIESASVAMAKKVGNAFKSAYSGLFGGGKGKGPPAQPGGPQGGGAPGGGGPGGGGGSILGRAAGQFLGNLATKAFDGAINAGANMLEGANQVYEAANRLSISARGAGKDYVDPQALTNEFFQVAQDVKGITAEQAADAASRFVTMTGDLATARSSLKDFAIAASASGSEVGSVAETAAAISQQFGITDPGQIKEVLAALIYQGKSGAFELRDAASLFPRLAAAGASFGLEKGTGGVKTLGGLVQIARTGTGSGEMAATAVENALTNLKLKTKELKSAGVKVYEGGKTRDLPTILIEAIAKVGGKSTEKKQAGLSQIFGEQGIRAINPLISKFNDITQKGGTVEQGMAALREVLDSSINAPGTWADVVEDSAKAQETTSARITSSMEKIKGALAEKLLPKITEFVEGLANAPGKIDTLISAFDLLVLAAEAIIGVAQAAGLIKEQTLQDKAKGKEAETVKLNERAAKVAEDAAKEQDATKKKAMLDEADQLRRRANTTKLQADEYRAMSEETSGVKLAKKVGGTAAVERADVLAADMQDAAAKQAQAPAAAKQPQGKARTEITNEVKVRVVNPNEFGSQSPGGGPSPVMPGFLPR